MSARLLKERRCLFVSFAANACQELHILLTRIDSKIVACSEGGGDVLGSPL